MAYEPVEGKRLYVRAEALADEVWEVVAGWDWFARKTVGTQLVRAADAVGANFAEASGRFHPNDVKNFLYYARGSLRETKYFLRRATSRSLLDTDKAQALDEQIEQLSREINAQVRFQKFRNP